MFILFGSAAFRKWNVLIISLNALELFTLYISRSRLRSRITFVFDFRLPLIYPSIILTSCSWHRAAEAYPSCPRALHAEAEKDSRHVNS